LQHNWQYYATNLQATGCVFDGIDTSITTCQSGTAVDFLTVASRQSNQPQDYYARVSIVFTNGFTSSDGDSFTAQIDSTLGTCLSPATPDAFCLTSKPLNDTTGLIPPASPCQQVRNQSEVKAALLYS